MAAAPGKASADSRRPKREPRTLGPAPVRAAGEQHEIPHRRADVDPPVHLRLERLDRRLGDPVRQGDVRVDRGVRPFVGRVLGERHRDGNGEAGEGHIRLGDDQQSRRTEPASPAESRLEETNATDGGREAPCPCARRRGATVPGRRAPGRSRVVAGPVPAGPGRARQSRPQRDPPRTSRRGAARPRGGARDDANPELRCAYPSRPEGGGSSRVAAAGPRMPCPRWRSGSPHGAAGRLSRRPRTPGPHARWPRRSWGRRERGPRPRPAPFAAATAPRVQTPADRSPLRTVGIGGWSPGRSRMLTHEDTPPGHTRICRCAQQRVTRAAITVSCSGA